MNSMDRPITLHQPKRLEVGVGTAATLGDWAADAKRPFVIAGGPTAHYVERLRSRRHAQ